MNRFADALRQLETGNRRRFLRPAGGADFSSNDYLGFASHPALRRTMLEWAESGGVIGSGGSRLLRGNHPAHEELEHFAAQFFGAEKALYFATGFHANHALFATLPERRDVVVHDSLIHASAREGIRASSVPAVKFRHNDLNDCEDALRSAREKADCLWLAVESVYSMEGDIAPLPDFHDLCLRYDAWLIVDEAHATGIFGANGRGVSEGLPSARRITLHTGGKALGVAGGLVTAPAEIVDYLVNKARPFIYSTAPLPVQAALLHRALKLVDEEPERRKRLLALRDHANTVLPVPPSATQIIPVILGDDESALKVAAALQESGFDVRAIRPPTVPEGTARLRLSLNTGLDEKILDALAERLTTLLERQAA
ncbi:MAG: 8-amino-7-oxononanoate synthase [Pseudomonadota bacterium]